MKIGSLNTKIQAYTPLLSLLLDTDWLKIALRARKVSRSEKPPLAGRLPYKKYGGAHRTF